MRFWNLIRYALISCVAGASLVACGGSQPPISVPGAMSQTSTVPPARASAGPTRNTSSYQVLYRFNLQHRVGSGFPLGGLVNVGGTLYGTTTMGHGTAKQFCSCGTVYSITTAGAYNTVYAFHRAKKDGAAPESSLIDVNGTLYGTTINGGSQNYGTVYSVTPTGAEKVLHSFTGGSDGAYPAGPLLYMSGTLYGTTPSGGGYGSCSNAHGNSCGIVYSVTTSGEEKVLYAFKGGSDGGNPSLGLTNVNGTMYGTTVDGGGTGCGSSGCGTVYSITTSGQENVLHSFAAGADGWEPLGLVNVKGTLYGTTNAGGTGCSGFAGCGTVFSITTAGNKKVLYNFRGGSDGYCPNGPLIHVKGKLYGTTTCGGGCVGEPCGTVYSVTTTGAEHVLYRFTDLADGFAPGAPLLNVNGTLYGTTSSGGGSGSGYGVGVIYTLTP